MAVCRIYLFTYNRNHLLPRAVQSLIDQTLKDWICEVHNDAPGDSFPSEFVNSLNDNRFIVNNHPKNLGATSSFNLAFAGCDEKYASILEDDNWWETTFLEEMIALMESKQDVDVAWSNMYVWEEKENDEWINTGNTIWPKPDDLSFTWPQPKQALGALHSNGAMIYRGVNASAYVIPNETLLDSVELVRERVFRHPIYLNAKILANFSITATTNRSAESWKWTACQVMQLSSMVISANKPGETFNELLNHFREEKSGSIVNFFLANLFYIKKRSLYKYFKLKDWLIYTKWLVKNPVSIFRLKNHLKNQAVVYEFLLVNTRKRFNESA